MLTFIFKTVRQVRRVIIAVIGLTVVLLGLIMIITPGPAIVVIPVGLGILATEFIWARKLMEKVKATLKPIRQPDGQQIFTQPYCQKHINSKRL